MPILYYGLAAVGTAALILAVYNLIIFKHCRRRHAQSSPSSSSSSASQPPNNRVNEVAVATRSNFDIRLSRNMLLESFKYKKESEEECECSVCLCGFEEGEEVRKLPRCKHRFHALCIDMWLFSHFDCPLCRTPVLQFCHLFPPQPPPTSSEEGVLRSAFHGGLSV